MEIYPLLSSVIVRSKKFTELDRSSVFHSSFVRLLRSCLNCWKMGNVVSCSVQTARMSSICLT